MLLPVALRKESVDRNGVGSWPRVMNPSSLSARRAWIEIGVGDVRGQALAVALRKESVDRNLRTTTLNRYDVASLSARRAWIEMRLT